MGGNLVLVQVMMIQSVNHRLCIFDFIFDFILFSSLNSCLLLFTFLLIVFIFLSM